ncbi:hypothetical protein ACF044_05060 [Microbacterium sp. NPDC016588]
MTIDSNEDTTGVRVVDAEPSDSLSAGVTTPATGSRIPPLSEPTDWEGATLPDEVSNHPLLAVDSFGVPTAWIELRDRGRNGTGVRKPLDASRLLSSHQSRAEFLVGAWIITKIVPERIRRGGLLANLEPQMLRTADILAAGGPFDADDPQPEEGAFENAILEPRRSAKTTSLWCVLLGRCYMRPVYMAGYTMLTTAKKAGERFKLDVRDPIRRKWRNPKDMPMKLTDGNGNLGVEFDNGSKLAVLSPNGDDVRSGAYDILVLDEAGEAEPEMWDDIIASVIPSFDTRPGGQIVLAGTGGKYRIGSHFWAILHKLTAGRLRYGVPDDVDERLLQSWEAGAGALIDNLHPGLDGLTKLTTVQQNFGILGPNKFGREYCGHFDKDATNDSLLSGSAWEAGREGGDVPTGITPLVLAFAVHLGGAWASVAVGWYVDAPEPTDLVQAALGETDPPRPAVKLIHHQEGNAGLAQTLFALARETRLAIVYDDSPQEVAVIEEVERMARRARIKIRTEKVRYAEKAVATTKLLNGTAHNTFTHWPQEPLDAAAAIATPRISGKARLIGTPEADQDATPLDAVALVLLKLPEPVTAKRKFIVAS